MTEVRRLFFLSLLFVASLLTVHAETLQTVITQHYTTDEGLPSNNVQCVLKDQHGFLWFGTWYGLCRFDGDKFVTYNHPLRQHTELPPRKIESMAEDSRGVLWVKTVDWKLYTFNPLTERFHAVNNELKKHTHNLQVIKIQRTNEGRILLLTKDKTLLQAYTDANGKIQIQKIFDSNGKIHPQTLALTEDVITTAHGYTAYIGRDYRLFIRSKCKRRQMVDAMQQDSLRQQQQRTRLEALAREAGISGYSQLYANRDSILWVTTTADGIYSISQPPQQFNLIQLPDGDTSGIRCLYQMRNGTILVGARSRNVYLYNAQGQLLRSLPYDRYAIGAVYHATEDQRGRLWLSTKGDGLVVIAPSASKEMTDFPTDVQHYRYDPANTTSLSGKNVYMTHIDSQGHIWVATLDGGLNLVNEHPDGTLSFFNRHNGFQHYPAYGLYTAVRNIQEDQQGRLWIGTTDGLMSLDTRFTKPQALSFTTYREHPDATFANNDIYVLHTDLTGKLWVGAFGGGLQQLLYAGTAGAPTFQPLGAREGLRNDVIFSMVDDRQGRLWFATERGLSCYNQQTHRIRNFDRYDGIPNLKMEEASALCTTTGTLWIGTQQGILVFNPQLLQAGRADYRTYILELITDTHAYLGDVNLAFADHVELEHDQNAFTIEFAALNYQNHGNVNYRYRLEGFDRDWRYSGIHRVGSYNEVPPGHYTFVVETIDDANPMLHSSASLSIRILPPWWATWWAYLIYAALALLITWLIVRTILKMNRMRNEIYISQRLAKLTSKPDDGDEFIDRVHRIIRQNISNGDFIIDDLASEMGLSRSAFYKKVKGQTGFAPVDLIKEFRISHAAELLKTTTLSITEVAYRSGFKDASYFGKCFRKRYGITPREYARPKEN